MAALLTGARLVLRQGLRILPTCYRVRPVAVPDRRCLSISVWSNTADIQDKTDVASDNRNISAVRALKSFNKIYDGLKSGGRVDKQYILDAFQEICQAGTVHQDQALFLLRLCKTSMPSVPFAEKVEIVDRIWNKLPEMGVVLDSELYNALLDTYLENEHKFSPIEFLASMEASGVNPNQSTYEKLIAAYCNEGDIQGASKILDFMKNECMPITENIFNSLITGHSRSGDMEKAKNILSIMEEAGLYPGNKTHEMLLCAYAENGDIVGFNQTLNSCNHYLTNRFYLKVIYCLSKSGHTQFVPDILKHVNFTSTYNRDVLNSCLMLNAQGYEDTALLVANKCIPVKTSELFFNRQPWSFFIHQCIILDRPVDILKKFAFKLQESNLGSRLLEYALLCALKSKKTDLALNLLRVLKEEGSPVRTHYWWPLLASLHLMEIQDAVQVLKAMKEIGIEDDLDTFRYLTTFLKKAENPEYILTESGFKNDFNELFLSLLQEMSQGYKCNLAVDLLSSRIPLVLNQESQQRLIAIYLQGNDKNMWAQLTKLLIQDSSSLQKPLHQNECLGFVISNLLASMSDTKTREIFLHQYLDHLGNMNVIDAENLTKIKKLLKPSNVPQQKQEFNWTDNSTYSQLRNLIALQDVNQLKQFRLHYGFSFTLGMYMVLLRFYCEQNMPHEALQLSKEIKKRGFIRAPTPKKYISLFHVLAVNGLIEDAINVLKEMREMDVPIDHYCDMLFSHTFRILANKGDCDAVNQLHAQVEMLNLTHKKGYLCSSLVMVHLTQNNLVAAIDAMHHCQKRYGTSGAEYFVLLKLVQMEETDLLKNAVDFISDALGERVMLLYLLFVFIECGKYQEAKKIVQTPGLRALEKKITWITNRFRDLNKVEAFENFVEITQPLFDCNREEMYLQLLSLYDKNNDWTKAISLWHKIKTEKVPMTSNLLKYFSDIFEKNDQNILDHIPEFKDLNGSEVVKNQIYDLCKTEKLSEAYNLFMENYLLLDIMEFSVLVKTLLRAGMFEEASEVQNVYKRYYSDYNMDRHFLLYTLQQQVRYDCLKDALDTVKKILNENAIVPIKTLVMLKKAFAKKGDMESLNKLEVLTKTNKIQRPVLVNVNILMDLYTNKNYEEANEMISSILIKQPKTSVMRLYEQLMSKDMTEALEKLSITVEVLSNQFSVDQPVTELFYAYIMKRNVEKAKQLLERCSHILEQTQFLKKKVKLLRLHPQAAHIFDMIDILGSPLYKEIGYNCLMSKFLSDGNISQAVKLREKMKAEQIQLLGDHKKQLETLLSNAEQSDPSPEPQESVEPSNEEPSFSASNERL